MISVHDNKIYLVVIDSDNSTLTLHTYYDESDELEFTDVLFSGLYRHQFSNIWEGNIICDIYSCTLDKFYEHANLPDEVYCKTYEESKNPNFDKFKTFMNKNNLQCYFVDSSYGLCGWVIAKDLKFIKRRKKFKIDITK